MSAAVVDVEQRGVCGVMVLIVGAGDVEGCRLDGVRRECQCSGDVAVLFFFPCFRKTIS